MALAAVTTKVAGSVPKAMRNGAAAGMEIPVSPVTPLRVSATAFVVGGVMRTPIAPVGGVIVLAPLPKLVWVVVGAMLPTMEIGPIVIVPEAVVAAADD